MTDTLKLLNQIDELFQQTRISKVEMAKMKAQLKALRECYDYCVDVGKKDRGLRQERVELLKLKVKKCKALLASIQKLPSSQYKKQRCLLEIVSKLEGQCTRELTQNFSHLLLDAKKRNLLIQN